MRFIVVLATKNEKQKQIKSSSRAAAAAESGVECSEELPVNE